MKTEFVGGEFCVMWLNLKPKKTPFNQRSTQDIARTLQKPRISNTASPYNRNEIQTQYPTIQSPKNFRYIKNTAKIEQAT